MDKTDTKTAILMAAVEVMGEKGPAGMSASLLAAKAGISKSTLFHHFRSMDDIPLAALDLMSMDMLQLDFADDATLLETLIALGEATMALMDEHELFLRAYFSFCTKAMFDEQLRDGMARSLNAVREQMLEIFKRHLPEREAKSLGGHVMALLDGATMQEMITGEPSQIMLDWRHISKRLVKGYAP